MSIFSLNKEERTTDLVEYHCDTFVQNSTYNMENFGKGWAKIVTIVKHTCSESLPNQSAKTQYILRPLPTPDNVIKTAEIRLFANTEIFEVENEQTQPTDHSVQSE